MYPLNVLICSSDTLVEQRMSRTFATGGVKVETSSHLVNGLYVTQQPWDFLFVDLDGLDDFLCRVLPAIRRKYPNLPLIGIRGKSARHNFSGLGLGYGLRNDEAVPIGLELDAYLSELPRPEELMINFPQVAARYQSTSAELVI